MEVLALYAGRAGTVATATGVVPSAIAKSPVAGRVRVDADGLPGDEQVFHSHGGPDRALCVYPREHYAHWSATVPPAFGENITSAGVLEAETLIGEVWRIGGAARAGHAAALAVREGRGAARDPRPRDAARRARFTGLHLRVLEPGELGAGDAIERLGGPATGSRSPTPSPRASTPRRIRRSSRRCSRSPASRRSGASRPRRASAKRLSPPGGTRCRPRSRPGPSGPSAACPRSPSSSTASG